LGGWLGAGDLFFWKKQLALLRHFFPAEKITRTKPI
jgi:hypothetical protein